MSKIFVSYALLCIIRFNRTQAEDVIELNLPSPVTLINNQGLYTLWKTNTSIHLNSTNVDFKPCTISVDPIKDFIAMRIRAKELRNKKFILWASRSYNRNDGIIRLNYTALIVDSSSCTYKAVLIPEEKKSSKNWPLFFSRVVNTNDGFYFFYASHGKCSPCQFSLDGELLPLKNQLEPDEESVPFGLIIRPVDEIDSSKGYIYSLNFKNDTSIIKYLDADFKVIRRMLLQHPIHSLSVKYNKQPIISICYTSHNFVDNARDHNFKVHCDQLDSDLKIKFTVRLPVPDDKFVFGFVGLTHQIDMLGNMFIGLMQCSHKNKTTPASRQLRFFASNEIGEILDTRDYNKTNMRSISEWVELRSHLSLDQKYCIITDTVADFQLIDTHEVITCLDVSKYSD